MINSRPMALTGMALLILAYLMLWPGLTEPMLSLTGTVEKSKLVDIGREILRESNSTSSLVRSIADRFIAGLDTSGSIEAFDKTNSILGTAAELWRGQSRFVAVLIVTFSVIVPAIKALLILVTLMPLNTATAARLSAIANASGKWSMADVFVIAIFIAFLAGSGMSETKGLVDFSATIGVGFWWFLGYCLVSILGSQLLAASRNPVRATARTTRARPATKKKGAVRKTASQVKRAGSKGKLTGRPTGKRTSTSRSR